MQGNMIDQLQSYVDDRVADAAERPPRQIESPHGSVAWLVPEFPPGLPDPPPGDLDWWHGGGPVDGDMLLPSTVTGNAGKHRNDVPPLWPDPLGRHNAVHVTDRRVIAAGYAALHDEPVVYRVAPVEWLALDPYYPPTTWWACRTGSAVILERHAISRREAEHALALTQAFEALEVGPLL